MAKVKDKLEKTFSLDQVGGTVKPLVKAVEIPSIQYHKGSRKPGSSKASMKSKKLYLVGIWQ